MIITNEMIKNFEYELTNAEKSESTIKKYVHDVKMLQYWLDGKIASKELMLEYKKYLKENYAPASVNAAIASLNCFMEMNKEYELRLKALKIQKQIFIDSNKELTKAEFERLVHTAEHNGDERLSLIMQTICSTGIRVSELKYITVESVNTGTATIDCKGKIRRVFLPKQLINLLSRYIRKCKLLSGSIFVTKTGKPLDRSNICKAMKKLCDAANVVREKVFPHNLRHLFARVYYTTYKDIVRLADILGHSSINTTRIYTMETGTIHRQQIEGLCIIQRYTT